MIERAHQQGVNTLALTDHDTLDGLTEAAKVASQLELTLLPGVEISTTWNNKCFHIVGLNINTHNTALNQGLSKLQTTRFERAQKISEKLGKKRIHGAFEAVSQKAGKGMITRTHFADFLLHEGHVHSKQEAFDRYLAKGKTGFVKTDWADLELAIQWITDAGGVGRIGASVPIPVNCELDTAFINGIQSHGRRSHRGRYWQKPGGRNSKGCRLCRTLPISRLHWL